MVRYYTIGFHGITRRERNEDFERTSPEIEIPEGGEYLWDWYYDISDSIARVIDGRTVPISPDILIAWINLTRNVVSPDEYAILRAMDASYIEAMNVELEEFRALSEQARQSNV